ncbi:hypothetical protein [Georgenia alba]|uniref:SPW repeat-containing protein n=1 Tax=Georgenia alba TaxID=2233858 RepID=A0ABW2QBL3_9MICO
MSGPNPAWPWATDRSAPGQGGPGSEERSPTAPAGATALISAAIVGALVAVAGTLLHRWSHQGFPEGLVIAFLVVLVGSVFARAAADRLGILLHVLAALLIALGLTYLAPNQDVLVTDDLISRIWLLGLPVAAAVAAVTPGAWYADTPRAARGRQATR